MVNEKEYLDMLNELNGITMQLADLSWHLQEMTTDFISLILHQITVA